MRWRLLALFVLAACGGTARAPDGVPRRNLARRVVVISVDGMMAETYLNPDAHGLQIPTLRALVAGGAAGKLHGVMPTVTYPSHTTMVTGVPPRVHGIVSNKPLDPLGKNFDGWRWYAEDISAETVYHSVEAHGGTAALITWPVSVGAKVSYLVPEYWRAGGPDDQKLLRALSTPGLLDDVSVKDPDLWKHLTPPEIKDDSQIAIARYVLAEKNPDLTMIHIFELDDAQHDHAPWSPEAKATLEAIDKRIGTLLADLKASPEWPRTTLLVVSDHGFAPIDHELHLNALFAAHTLIREDAADVAVLSCGGTAFVYVLDPAKRAEVDAALAEVSEHVARRLDHADIVAAGGDPNAAFALVAAPGYSFSDKRTGDAVVALASPRGTHGWPPDDPAMTASVIAFGPNIPHADLGTVDMTDIAPTLARWLDVPLRGAMGKPIAAIAR